MVCTARARSELYAVDGKWMVKLRLRILQNVLCGLSIGAAAFTLAHKSLFQTGAFEQCGAVLYYVPAVVATIIWNTLNIVWLGRAKRPLPEIANAIAHFLMFAAFAIVGCVATNLTTQGLRNLLVDPYNIEVAGVHNTRAVNGTTITITPSNARYCPAFLSCDAQRTWMIAAHRRGLVALVGCVLVDTAFFIHLLFFIWSCANIVFEAQPRRRKRKGEEGRTEKRHTLHGKAIIISEPTLISAPWTLFQEPLLGPKACFAQYDESSRSSLSLSIFETRQTPELSLLDSEQRRILSSVCKEHIRMPPISMGEHSRSRSKTSFRSTSVTKPQLAHHQEPAATDQEKWYWEAGRSQIVTQSHHSYPTQRDFSLSYSRFGPNRTIILDRSSPHQGMFYQQSLRSQNSFANSTTYGDGWRQTADLLEPEVGLTALPQQVDWTYKNRRLGGLNPVNVI